MPLTTQSVMSRWAIFEYHEHVEQAGTSVVSTVSRDPPIKQLCPRYFGAIRVHRESCRASCEPWEALRDVEGPVKLQKLFYHQPDAAARASSKTDWPELS